MLYKLYTVDPISLYHAVKRFDLKFNSRNSQNVSLYTLLQIALQKKDVETACSKLYLTFSWIGICFFQKGSGVIIRRPVSRDSSRESPLEVVKNESKQYIDRTDDASGTREMNTARQQKPDTPRDVSFKQKLTSPSFHSIAEDTRLPFKGSSAAADVKPKPKKSKFTRFDNSNGANTGLKELNKLTKQESNSGFTIRKPVFPRVQEPHDDDFLKGDAMGEDLNLLGMSALERWDRSSTDADADPTEILEDLKEAIKSNIRIASQVNVRILYT